MILDQLEASAKKRVAREKEALPLDKLQKRANEIPRTGHFLFEETLRKEGMHYICEVKKASPSKGVIAEEFPYVAIAKEYEKAGADCISVLTEPEFFLGKNEYLEEIRNEVNIPILRKDFTVDDYQIYQAKVIGADAVLLICSLLEEQTLSEFIKCCDRLELSAVVEAHDEEEVKMAVRCGARILGVNNRNLKTFEVDVHNSMALRSLVPEEILFIAESGIKSAEDILVLKGGKVNAVLIGESLMKSKNKKEKLDELRGIC